MASAGPAPAHLGGEVAARIGAPHRSLEIRLLGGFSIRLDGEPQPDPGLWSVRSLVALLALAGRPGLRRAEAAEALWPDSLSSQAATNLRKALFALSQRLPEVAALIAADVQTLSWRAELDVAVDVARFEELARQAAGESELKRALEAYAGDLLPECPQPWAEEPRIRLAALYDRLCRALALLLERERRYPEALELALAVAERNPADEASWAWALRLAASAGGKEALHQVWSAVEHRFARAFSDEPSELLRQDYQRLLALAAEPPADGEISFVGRTRQWASLRAAWDLSRRGQFGLVWVEGESGIGKSALAGEFARWVAAQGVNARIGHASGVPGPSLEAVVSALGSGPPLPALAPPWAEELGALLAPGSMARPDAPAVAPLSEGSRLRRLMAAVEAMVADAPCVWVLDDLQDADGDSWDWIRLAARHLSRLPALLVAVSRSDRRTVARRRELFEAVGSAVACQLIVVGPLSDAEAASLVRQVAAPPPQVEAELLAIAQGSPLHLLEAARLWLLEKESGGSELGLGPTMQATLARRLAHLPSVERRLAEALALLGRPADPRWLIACTKGARLSSVEDLIQTRIVTADEGGRLSFHHSALAEAVLRQIAPRRRQQLAGLLAGALAESGAGLGDQGRLWEEAGEKERAREAYRQLAAQAERACLLEEAAFARARLLALSPPAEQPEIALGRADMLYQAGLAAEAEAAYRQTIQLAVSEGALAIAASGRLGLARILSLGGDVVSAQVLAEDSGEVLAAIGDERQRALALLCRGELFGLRQDFDQAEHLLGEARVLAERCGELPVAVSALNRLGDLEYERGQYAAATDSYHQARQSAERCGDLGGLLEATGSLGVVLEETGKLAAGAGYQREVVELAHSHGLSRHLCYGLNNLGACYQGAGRWAEAERLVAASLRLALDTNDMRAISVITGVLALCRAEQEDKAGGERLSDLAMALARAFPIPSYLALQICHLTDLLLDSGRLERVGPLLEEAWPVREAGTPQAAVRLELNRIRWRQASGQISRRAAREEMAAVAGRPLAAEARALVTFRMWELSGAEADRRRALGLVSALFEYHPHVWWQRCQEALGGGRPELPDLPGLPDWLDPFAPLVQDLLPWLDAYVARHGSPRRAGPQLPPDQAGGTVPALPTA